MAPQVSSVWEEAERQGHKTVEGPGGPNPVLEGKIGMILAPPPQLKPHPLSSSQSIFYPYSRKKFKHSSTAQKHFMDVGALRIKAKSLSFILWIWECLWHIRDSSSCWASIVNNTDSKRVTFNPPWAFLSFFQPIYSASFTACSQSQWIHKWGPLVQSALLSPSLSTYSSIQAKLNHPLT